MLRDRITITGIAFFIVGAIVLIFGLWSSQSVLDQLSRIFSGRLTDQTAWTMIGGAIVCIVGLLLTFTGSHRHHVA